MKEIDKSVLELEVDSYNFGLDAGVTVEFKVRSGMALANITDMNVESLLSEFVEETCKRLKPAVEALEGEPIEWVGDRPSNFDECVEEIKYIYGLGK